MITQPHNVAFCAFGFLAATIWNSVPYDIRGCDIITVYKCTHRSSKKPLPSHNHSFCYDYGMIWCRLQVTLCDPYLSDCDEQFFKKITNNSSHIPQQFIPDRITVNYNLRTRSHNKHLIPKTSDLNERNFLIRNLYKDCY